MSALTATETTATAMVTAAAVAELREIQTMVARIGYLAGLVDVIDEAIVEDDGAPSLAVIS